MAKDNVFKTFLEQHKEEVLAIAKRDAVFDENSEIVLVNNYLSIYF